MVADLGSVDQYHIPVLLLKTKSSPGDSYEELFSAAHDNLTFESTFVPVLQHKFNDDGLVTVRQLLNARRINLEPGASYGGLIFTSQRAVEAFTNLVEEGQNSSAPWPHLQSVPVYSVGPATTRALSAVPQSPALCIHGSHTGNGEALAAFILDHYQSVYPSRDPKPPLLFLVGEQRRDIIPKTLMDLSLPKDRRVEVEEVPVYGTGVMESFPEDFARVLESTKMAPQRWVVVFSPTGCEAMLNGLALLDAATGKVKEGVNGVKDGRSTFVATIGPTTQDFLRKTFGFEPDVCAEKPTPEGVREGIAQFIGATRSDEHRVP